MDDTKTVWCGNLADQVTEELLYELFLQAAPLERVKIPTDKEGRKSNFAFITFKHEQSVNYVLQLLNGTRLFDKALNVKPRIGNQQNRPIDRNAGQLDFQNKINLLRLGGSMISRFDHSPNRFADNRQSYSGNNSFHEREDKYQENHMQYDQDIRRSHLDREDKHYNKEMPRDIQYDQDIRRSHLDREDKHYNKEMPRDIQYDQDIRRNHHDIEDQHYEQEIHHRDVCYDRDVNRSHVHGRRNHSDTPYKRHNHNEGRNHFNSRHGRRHNRY